MKRNLTPHRKSLFLVVGLAVVVSVFANLSFAQPLQRVEIPSSFNPVGSGARALGMGGAFIAVADDATAASWNPGGLIQLETSEISIVGAYFDRTEDNSWGTHPEASGDQGVYNNNINYLSAAYPFTFWGRNMIVSLNYQYLYDFTSEWHFSLNQLVGEILSVNRNFDNYQEGSLSAIGLAYSIQINPQFSFGITLNFWEDGIYDNEWENKTGFNGSGTYEGFPISLEGAIMDRYSFSGFNVHLGVLWNINSKLTLGAVLKTPFTADVEHERRDYLTIVTPSIPEPISTGSGSFRENEDLDMPMSYGIGVAYRFSDELTASFDIFRTEWGDFVLEDSNGNKTSPISGKPENESDVEATHQVRMGVEYLFITPKYVIPLRGGLFYDPAPAEGSPDDFFGFSIGSGIAMGRFVFDIAYQYRFGNDVRTSILQNFNFSQDVDEHTLYSSLIFHF